MATTEILWLSRREIEAAGLEAVDCINLVHQAMEWQGSGLLEVPAKVGIHPPKGRHINAMPAYLRPLSAAGLKWVADYPENKKLGLATIHGLIVLNDTETGVPFCVMEGALVTAKRTAAMTGVSCRACALPNLTLGTIVGTGIEAVWHVLTLPKALPELKTLRVVGRDLEAAKRFCREMASVANLELAPFPDRETAVRESQLIITVTNAVHSRLLEPDWIAEGATIVVLDNAGKESTLLPAIDWTIVDDRRPFETEEVRRRFPTGFPRIDGEVGEVISGRLAGRRHERERVLVLNLGSAACDIVVATEIYKRASKLGLGKTVEL